MLSAERLDAVVVAVPAQFHEPVACAAIAAGAAVLVEKPLAPSYAGARRLVEAAKAAGVLLMPGHIERFNPAIVELSRRVQAGEIGRVLQIAARRMSATRAGVHGSRLPPTDVNVVHDSAIHDIDAARFILGLEVESVFGVAQAGLVTASEDSISAIMRFRAPGGGSMADTVREARPASEDAQHPPAKGTPHGPVASLEVNWLAPRRVRDLTVLGERGMFHVDYAAQSLALFRTPGEQPEEIEITRGDQLEAELSAFVAAVRQGTPPPVTPQDGLAAVAIADAITRSARSGKPVSLREVAQ
jgi:predicted dehydrogenase